MEAEFGVFTRLHFHDLISLMIFDILLYFHIYFHIKDCRKEHKT